MTGAVYMAAAVATIVVAFAPLALAPPPPPTAPGHVESTTPAPLATSTCPDGAKWEGRPPPDGYEYFCAVERDGQKIRHGWFVRFSPTTGEKIDECEYRDGLRHGRCSVYSENGGVLQRGFYERDRRTGYWWFWDLLISTPDVRAERRSALEELLRALEVPETDAPVLAHHVLERYGIVVADIRYAPQVCGSTHCVSAGTVAGRGVVAIQFGAPAEKVEVSRQPFAVVAAKLKKEKAAEAKLAAVEAKRAAAEERRRRKAAAAAAKPRPPAEPTFERVCCKYCSTGKPCGDSCIARNKTCHRGRGCAC